MSMNYFTMHWYLAAHRAHWRNMNWFYNAFKNQMHCWFNSIFIKTHQKSTDFRTSVLWFLLQHWQRPWKRVGYSPHPHPIFGYCFRTVCFNIVIFVRIWNKFFFFDRFSPMFKTQYTMFETTLLQIVPVLSRKIGCDETDFI